MRRKDKHVSLLVQEGSLGNGFWRPGPSKLLKSEKSELGSSFWHQRKPSSRKDKHASLPRQEGGLGNNGSWRSGQPAACAQRPKMPAVAIQMGCNQSRVSSGWYFSLTPINTNPREGGVDDSLLGSDKRLKCELLQSKRAPIKVMGAMVDTLAQPNQFKSSAGGPGGYYPVGNGCWRHNILGPQPNRQASTQNANCCNPNGLESKLGWYSSLTKSSHIKGKAGCYPKSQNTMRCNLNGLQSKWCGFVHSKLLPHTRSSTCR